MIGLWKTDAPLSPERMDAHRATLNSVWAAFDGVVAYADHDVALDELVVYIDGVRWTWESVRTVGGPS